MEMPHLGSKCSRQGCRELNDYLPFKCSYCKSQYCKEHQKALPEQLDNGHFCSQFPIDKRALVCPVCDQIVPSKPLIDPNVLMEEHIRQGCRIDKQQMYKNQCSFGGCKKKELMPIQCKICLSKFCISHRLEQDHACLGPPKSRLLNFGTATSKSSIRSKNSRKEESCLVS